MALNVRLDAATEAALARYCAERGVTKVRVVRAALAMFMRAGRNEKGDEAANALRQAPPSANYRAFAEAGLIGACAVGGGSADNAAVRTRIAEHFSKRMARRGFE